MAVAEPVMSELNGTVADVMTKQVVALSPKSSAAEAAELLTESHTRHAIVVDDNRHVLGVVSQRDLLAHFISTLSEQETEAAAAAPADGAPAPWELGSLLKQDPITLSPGVALVAAGRVLAQYKIGCLPVVDEKKQLVGSLSIHELLRHIATKMGSTVEDEFSFFRPETEARPKTPAFFRRANGALVLPISCLEDPNEAPEYAVLGYEPKTGRILVKFVSDKEDGFRRIIKDSDSLVIPASDFVSHFDIKFHGTAFDVSRNKHTSVLILTPKQTTAARPAPAGSTGKQ